MRDRAGRPRRRPRPDRPVGGLLHPRRPRGGVDLSRRAVARGPRGERGGGRERAPGGVPRRGPAGRPCLLHRGLREPAGPPGRGEPHRRPSPPGRPLRPLEAGGGGGGPAGGRGDRPHGDGGAPVGDLRGAGPAPGAEGGAPGTPPRGPAPGRRDQYRAGGLRRKRGRRPAPGPGRRGGRGSVQPEPGPPPDPAGPGGGAGRGSGPEPAAAPRSRAGGASRGAPRRSPGARDPRGPGPLPLPGGGSGRCGWSATSCSWRWLLRA